MVKVLHNFIDKVLAVPAVIPPLFIDHGQAPASAQEAGGVDEEHLVFTNRKLDLDGVRLH